MNDNGNNNLTINGLGSSNGGVFDKVSLNGTGTVHGDIECTELQCNGMGTVQGNTKASRMRVSGTSKLNGSVDVQEGIIEGTAKILDNAYMKRLRISGATSIGGYLKGDELHVHGSVTVADDCEVEIFKSNGIFNIGGLLNAEQIEVVLYGECKARELGGRRIKIKQKHKTILKIFPSLFPVRLVTDAIEGDDIDLENTKAEIVRGNHVVIGSGCEIGVVEYSGTIKLHKNAMVRESRKI